MISCGKSATQNPTTVATAVLKEIGGSKKFVA
jgi:hypothetical protein